MPGRFNQIINEIVKNNADVICLQEVSDKTMIENIAKLCKYNHLFFYENMGLAVLSKSCILKTYNMEYAVSVVISYMDKQILFINVHLPWKSAIQREQAIVDIVSSSNSIKVDYTLILGDFNCSNMSSVHRFLLGEQSLLEHDAYFFDLAEAYAENNRIIPPPTLNFKENPRFNLDHEINTIQTNQRFDRILLKNPYPNQYPILEICGLFGTSISPDTGLSASDHYGVFADLIF